MCGSAWNSLLLLLVVGVAGQQQPPPFGHPSPSKSYPSRPGFTLWLVEEFDAPLDLNTDPIWTWSDGAVPEGQARFVKEAIGFAEGKMRITVSDTPQAASCSHAEVDMVPCKPLSSGELRTKYNMFRYGYYEVRMRAPRVQPADSKINGNYIASMFTFRTPKTKHWREIDIELLGGTPNSMTMSLITGDGVASWSPAIQSVQTFVAEGRNFRDDFHTYAFEWLPSGITWFFDGRAVGFHGPGDSLPIPEKSAKIMMNLWIFGEPFGFGGLEGQNNRYPMQSEYDWFRFYKWDGDSQYPCKDPAGSCLSAEDMVLSSNNPCDGIPQVGGAMPCSTAACDEAPHSAAVATGTAGDLLMAARSRSESAFFP